MIKTGLSVLPQSFRTVLIAHVHWEEAAQRTFLVLRGSKVVFLNVKMIHWPHQPFAFALGAEGPKEERRINSAGAEKVTGLRKAGPRTFGTYN